MTYQWKKPINVYDKSARKTWTAGESLNKKEKDVVELRRVTLEMQRRKSRSSQRFKEAFVMPVNTEELENDVKALSPREEDEYAEEGRQSQKYTNFKIPSPSSDKNATKTSPFVTPKQSDRTKGGRNNSAVCTIL